VSGGPEINGWSLAYRDFDPEQEGLREALCTLGNGYFATRGAAPEATADDIHYPGTYVSGVYNRLETSIDGRIVENEDLVNVPNWLPLTFRIDEGPWLDLSAIEVLEYEQELDLRHGVLIRKFRFRDVSDRVTSVTQQRIVSMRDSHVAALQMTLVAENWSGRIDIRSGLDGRVTNSGVVRYRPLRGDHLKPLWTRRIDDETILLEVETCDSHIRIAEAARTRIHGANVTERRLIENSAFIAMEAELDVKRGEPLTVEKVVTLFTSRDRAVSRPGIQAQSLMSRIRNLDDLRKRHALMWGLVWGRFDLRVDRSTRAQAIIRLHIFHLLQTISEHTMELDAGVPARGLHGEAYRGHVFWDELFVFPFLNLRLSVLTRSLLEYRRRRLQPARWAAESAGYRGAMYPWQSGSDGTEESQIMHLNPKSGRWVPDHSHLQKHVNIAVAYNIWQHYQVTGDIEYMRHRAAEMLLEIARFWASAATYNKARDKYEIHRVMGPDEFHDSYPGASEPGLNNNAYTNVMAVWVLRRAFDTLEILPDYHVQELRDLLDLGSEEIERWDDVSRRMFVPFHDGVISQFEGYEDLDEFAWEDYFARYSDLHRLDRILEAENDSANRYKVSKQADVLMLFYLLSGEELKGLFDRLGYPFDPAHDIERNVDYYMKRTSHGSTLSRLVHSWVLARLDRPRSWTLFLEALDSDIADAQSGSTPEGIHLGAMAGTVDLVQRAFGGVSVHDDVLWIDPAVPEELGGLSFPLRYRGHRLNIVISREKLRVTSQAGPARPIRVGLKTEITDLRAGASREIPL
jgi:alpha,alpha-trehalase